MIIMKTISYAIQKIKKKTNMTMRITHNHKRNLCIYIYDYLCLNIYIYMCRYIIYIYTYNIYTHIKDRYIHR